MDLDRALHASRPKALVVVSFSAALLMLGAPPPAHAADRALPHVRSVEPGLARLLAAGANRSATLQALIERLDQSNVIVYIERAMLGATLMGRLRFVGTSDDWRFLRVQIDCRVDLADQVAILGHELQHAVEIADAAATVDEPSLQRLYHEIGFALDSDDSRFESERAVVTGQQVRREWLAAAPGVRRAVSYGH